MFCLSRKISASRPACLLLAALLAGLEIRVAAADTPDKSPEPPSGSVRRAPIAGPVVAQLVRVIDGDTFEARIRIWFGQEITTLIRLRNIDAPELKARCPAEAQLAGQARQTLEDILRSGSITLSHITLDKFGGRVIASVHVMNGGASDDAGLLLLAGGYARRYRGGVRRGWCS